MQKKNSFTRALSQYSFVLVFIAIFIVYAITSNGLTWNGVMNIFRHSAVIGIIAIGMGMVCITGEIDLSVGSMLALISGFAVVIYNMTGSIVLTLLFCLGFGAVCGLINGVLVGYVRMPAFIVTLATMLIYRSFASISVRGSRRICWAEEAPYTECPTASSPTRPSIISATERSLRFRS